eukprot:scaffold6050_cov107-Isochrysis_galbana.AAC.2
MEAEAVASGRAAEHVAYAREVLRALGTPIDGPTLVGTDNLANMRVGSLAGCPSRSRHFLRRWLLTFSPNGAAQAERRSTPASATSATLGFTPNDCVAALLAAPPPLAHPIRMEYPPADARAAPSASAPTDTVMDIASSPKRPRDQRRTTG